ncbi:hypothetical protein [Marinobacter salicampi]|uniref:hypothetical protein n=1 Tax=Marinobacter salicampi TaxID=435907 RepID=UPI00140908C3|nr:hypothetical protein [Marinobacter salicampi]
MRALAQFVMRGPLQAAGVAVVTMAVPLLFWIGAAVVGLVTLRLGLKQGLNIGIWAVLPALGWAIAGGDPTALAVLILVFVMSAVLGITFSWERSLVVGSALTLIIGFLLPLLYPGLLDQLVQAGVSFYEQYNPEVAQELGGQLESAVRQTMNASMAGAFLMTAIALTMLSRSWQAKLYNPGGFREEFHSFRLSGPVATLSVVAMVGGPLLDLNSVLIVWVAGTPLVIAAIALVHGLVGRRGMGVQWLVMFYIALLILGPSLLLVLVVLAFVDSWLDIRRRIKPAGPAE